MSDPKLTRTVVKIDYRSDDGHQTQILWRTDLRRKEAPHEALLFGIEEAARLLALYGYESEAREIVEGAFTRIRNFKESRLK